MADSPLIKKLRERARGVGSRAAQELINRTGGSDAVGAAVRSAQGGRQVIDDGTAHVLATLGLATREDFERVSRRVGKLRKRLQRLVNELDES